MLKRLCLTTTLLLLFTAAVYAQGIPGGPTLPYIHVMPESATVAAGDTEQFSAIVVDENGDQVDEPEVSWDVSDETVGTIDAEGLFTGVAAGETDVIALWTDVADTVSVEVTAEDNGGEASLTVIPAELELEVGENEQFDVEAVDENGDQVESPAVTWLSSDESVGTVDGDGLFVAAGEGSVTVFAAWNDLVDSASVSVLAAQDDSDDEEEYPLVKIFPGNVKAVVGDDVQFEVMVKDENGDDVTDPDVTWAVTDETYGSVDETGLFTAAEEGELYVTATWNALIDSARVRIEADGGGNGNGYTATFYREFNEGHRTKFGSAISGGETVTVGGLPFPFNYLNGAKVTFPEGSLNETIEITINIPDFARVDMSGGGIEFDGDLLTAVTFEVTVDGEVVEPYVFGEPLEVTLPFKKGLLTKLGIDAEELGLYFVGQNGELNREGIDGTVVDGDAGQVSGKVAHFSNIAIAPEDSPLAVDAEPAPEPFSLGRNYPNPFNPETTIPYTLAENTRVSVTVYSILGQTIRTLVDDVQPAGMHNVVWDGRDENGIRVTSGVYIYTIEAAGAAQSRKLMLMK